MAGTFSLSEPTIDPPGTSPPKTKVTIEGKNEIYHLENLVGHFWYTNFGPRTPPALLPF